VSINAVDQRTPRLTLWRALLLVGTGCLAASASHAAVSGEWSEGVSRDQSFARVLVVGISPDVNTRCRFERALAAKLKSANTAAIISCDVMDSSELLTREAIEAAVAAQNADAVLATSLISREWDVKEGGGRDTRGAAYYKATDSFYGVYGTVVAADFRASAPLTTLDGAAHVTSKLYETRGATVVYTVDTKVRNIETRDEGIAAISEPIAKRLRRDGLIR
jgi:hypothetical protein